ncbi:hypothetical protein AMK59_1730 [Oryctes borbonicus]|uniref:Uncharacterized protein n=1 Tax=Oryctes borbonicus TaxID=1629725 RepID=A0A0T6B9E5_9SCAR|nr:hypothetical protein AMK59_1730 [Oryctes borbonicus]
MAKNDITPERKHKRDTFFKKPKQNQMRNQPNKNDFQTSESKCHASNSFFIKNTSHTKETASKSKQNTQLDTTKKPFDKKKWRLQRYSKKYKLQQWEETRKKVILKEYYKQTKGDTNTNFNVQQIYEDAQKDDLNSSMIDELENENNLNSEITNDNVSELNRELSTNTDGRNSQEKRRER